jgi:hypothetical protein
MYVKGHEQAFLRKYEKIDAKLTTFDNKIGESVKIITPGNRMDPE